MNTLYNEVPSKPVGLVAATVATVDASLAWAADQFFVWRQRTIDRQALQKLDEHMLHDIGLSRGDVELEASKPFWRS
jgi:uncharacterized protein YjiS (DUF1127 family)